jgi:hypothetical protein
MYPCKPPERNVTTPGFGGSWLAPFSWAWHVQDSTTRVTIMNNTLFFIVLSFYGCEGTALSSIVSIFIGQPVENPSLPMEP